MTSQSLNTEFCNVGTELANKTHEISIKQFIYERLIEIFPEEAAFYYLMGFAIKGIYPEKALEFFQKSYDIEPNNVENCIDLCDGLYRSGRALQIVEMGKTGKLEQFLNDPRFLTIYTQAKCEQFYYKDCLKYLLHLIRILVKKPAVAPFEKDWKFSNYLNAGHVYIIYSNHEKSVEYTEKAFELSLKFDLPLHRKLAGIQNLLSFMEYGYVESNISYKKALRINEILPDIKYFTPRRERNHKIRIGYVSSDFANHAVSNFILPILRNHDLAKFELYVYPNQPEHTYSLNNIRAVCHSIFNLDDKTAATIIYRDKIDILFDLNGHTANGRLGLFTYNPAPIQIAYIGYPNTTGLKCIHYRITDNVADHPESKQLYSETLVKLPKCFLLYESISQSHPNSPRKTGNPIIFGALNKEKKNSKYVLETWRRLLEVCPTAKLLIKLDGYDDLVARTEFYTTHLNVDKSRLLIYPKTSDVEYIRLFTMIDVLLDTFPYSGTTTTCNALYNSIPVVSHYNKDYHAHNVSSTVLIHSGLPELVAYSASEYVEILRNLTSDRIDKYKTTISNKFINLMSPREFMHGYETRLDTLYQNYNATVCN